MFQSHKNGAPPSEPKRSVLVVDDEPTLRLGFSYALSNRRTTVDTAATGRQALEKLREFKYDIVILDLRMPDIDGLGVIEALRSAGDLTPVVLCSAAITPSAALRALQHRVPDFLLKPVRPVDLRDIVDFVLSPPETTLSKALCEARCGKIQAAIHCIKPDALHDKIAAAWLDIMEMLIVPENEGGLPSLEQIHRNTLASLAFRSARAL